MGKIFETNSMFSFWIHRKWYKNLCFQLAPESLWKIEFMIKKYDHLMVQLFYFSMQWFHHRTFHHWCRYIWAVIKPQWIVKSKTERSVWSNKTTSTTITSQANGIGFVTRYVWPHIHCPDSTTKCSKHEKYTRAPHWGAWRYADSCIEPIAI